METRGRHVFKAIACLLAGAAIGFLGGWTIPHQPRSMIDLPFPHAEKIIFSPNGKLVAVAAVNTDPETVGQVCVCDLETRAILFTAPREATLMDYLSIAFSADSEEFLFYKHRDDRQVFTWEIATRKQRPAIETEGEHMVQSRDGRMLLAVQEGDGYVISDLRTNAEVARIENKEKTFRYWCADGCLFAQTTDENNIHKLRVWDAATGKGLAEFLGSGHVADMQQATVDRAQRIALHILGNIELIDVETGHAWTIEGPPATILPGLPGILPSLSPEGDFVAIACVEYTDATETWYLKPLVQLGALPKSSIWIGARIYDTRTGALVGALRAVQSESNVRPGSRVSRFSPDGTSLAVSMERHKLDIYDFPLRKPWVWIAASALLGALAAFLLVKTAGILLWASRRLLTRPKKQRDGLSAPP